MRYAEIPVPPRNGLPVLGRRDVEILNELIKRRGVGLREHLRGIQGDPYVLDAAVGERPGRILHVAERISDGHTLKGAILGRDDADGLPEYRTGPFEHENIFTF